MNVSSRLLGALAIVACLASAQAPTSLPIRPHDRLRGSITESSDTLLPGNTHPMARRSMGALMTKTIQMDQMVLSLKSDDTQQAELDKLITAQQDPKSPLYHKFLTPEEFASHFGISDR